MSARPRFRSALGHVLDAYADRCEAGHAERTLEGDYLTLRLLDEHLVESGYSGGAIPGEMLEGWISQLLEDLSPATVALHQRKANAILRLAATFGVPCREIEPVSVADAYQPYIFSPEQLVRLCAAADDISFKPASSYPWIRAEVPVLTRVFMGCGTRTSETLCLRMRDLDLDRGILTMRTTKGGVERYVPVADGLRDCLETYCRAMGVLGQPGSYLFPGLDRDSHLPRNMYYLSFRKMAAEAGIDPLGPRNGGQRGICPYCMRHTFACMALLHLQEQGVVVDNVYPYLSSYMGHKGLYSTERYLKLVEPMASRALKAYEEVVRPVYGGRAFDRGEVWD